MKVASAHSAVFMLALFLTACAAETARTSGQAALQWTSQTKRVVLVQPDIELSELDAGGIAEPRADWTEAAHATIEKGLKTHFGKMGAEIVDAEGTSPREVQLIKLHGAVGKAILIHAYSGSQNNVSFALPNKGSALDFTLGPGTNEMRDRYSADYALFIYVRDSYSSAAKVALDVLTVIAGAALGVGIAPAGGIQMGFASLVDLRTGDIIWFNRPVENAMGDLREETDDGRAANALLSDIPL